MKNRYAKLGVIIFIILLVWIFADGDHIWQDMKRGWKEGFHSK